MQYGSALCLPPLRQQSESPVGQLRGVRRAGLVPAVHSQAEDRAHRIDQQDSLLRYYLVSPNVSDRDMQDALGLKVSQFVAIMCDTSQSRENQFMQQTEAREWIRQLVDRLEREQGD